MGWSTTFAGFYFHQMFWHKYGCFQCWKETHAKSKDFHSTWLCHTLTWDGLTLVIQSFFMGEREEPGSSCSLVFPFAKVSLSTRGWKGNFFGRLPSGEINLSLLFILKSLVNVWGTDEAEFFGAWPVFVLTEYRHAHWQGFWLLCSCAGCRIQSPERTVPGSQ